MKATRAHVLPVTALLLLVSCKDRREALPEAPPTYRDVAPLLSRACLECHNDETRSGGYAVTDHWSTLGCTSDGRAVTMPADASAPLIRVLDQDNHRDLVSDAERDRLLAWLSAGTPVRHRVIHAVGILDPRSEGWHGKLAATDRYRALWDEKANLVCGRCHAGAPVAPKGKTGATDGATACTSCHTEREGVLACSTCHGDEQRAYPPRAACYFDGPATDPHAAHVADPQVRTQAFSCDTCHPVPSSKVFEGSHANGEIDIRFSSPLLDESAVRNDDGTCSVACHAQGGQRSTPEWKAEAKLDCQSCHTSPPADHPPGVCKTCHSNMGDAADSLVLNALHMNGVVDIGNRSGTCGSCHGADESGAPDDVAHHQHLTSTLTAPIQCITCHRVPTLDDLHEPSTHMNGTRDVVFSGRARSESRTPSYDAAQKSCAQVACHKDQRVETRWGQASQASSSCAACHRTPPPPPHSTEPGCGGGLCHSGEVAPTSPGFRITESGRTIHIDGVLQASPP